MNIAVEKTYLAVVNAEELRQLHEASCEPPATAVCRQQPTHLKFFTIKNGGKIGAIKYASDYHYDFRLCWLFMRDGRGCPHGHLCDWRHALLARFEIVGVVSLGKKGIDLVTRMISVFKQRYGATGQNFFRGVKFLVKPTMIEKATRSSDPKPVPKIKTNSLDHAFFAKNEDVFDLWDRYWWEIQVPFMLDQEEAEERALGLPFGYMFNLES